MQCITFFDQPFPGASEQRTGEAVEHRQLKTFGAVARALGFTRAAEEFVGYVQS